MAAMKGEKKTAFGKTLHQRKPPLGKNGQKLCSRKIAHRKQERVKGKGKKRSL